MKGFWYPDMFFWIIWNIYLPHFPVSCPPTPNSVPPSPFSHTPLIIFRSNNTYENASFFLSLNTLLVQLQGRSLEGETRIFWSVASVTTPPCHAPQIGPLAEHEMSALKHHENLLSRSHSRSGLFRLFLSPTTLPYPHLFFFSSPLLSLSLSCLHLLKRPHHHAPILAKSAAL